MAEHPDLEDLETPALVVDLDRMEANLDRAASYAAKHRLALRPHIKTHKSPRVAEQQLKRGAVGVTCATPYEAEVMSEVCDDILVMYPPVGARRAQRLAELAKRVTLTVALDSSRAAEEMSRAAATAGSNVGVLIEMDAGMHRVGVQSREDAVALARTIEKLPGVALAGIAFYPGHIRGHVDEQADHLRALGDFVARARETFARSGLNAGVISAGSTPTLWHTHEIAGVTEMRPGTYIYNDRTTAEIGACTLDECALTILATVVSTAMPGQAVVDAGSKALGREPIRGVAGEGFGALLEDPTVIVKSMSEEHGILDLTESKLTLRVGDRVRIVPNHVCIVVHLADLVYGVRDRAFVTSWPVAARGRGQPVFLDPSGRAPLGTSLGR